MSSFNQKSDLTPLFSAVLKHAEKNRTSFHTPGHKSKAGILSQLDLLKHDLTELPSIGDLFDLAENENPITQAERLTAKTFGAYDSFFSADGCTLCIQTMLLIFAKLTKGRKKLLCGRNAHKSLVNTLGLLGVEAEWIWPEKNQITPEEIEKGLAKNRDEIGGVFVTSPDYYGRIADIEKIAMICDEKNIPLLVDNAHGSHFGAFDIHPIKLGATMVADSFHKTLPVLTGGAVLHISEKANKIFSIDRGLVKTSMATFASTSPSFLTLASIDISRDWWQRAGERMFSLTADRVTDLKNTAEKAGVLFLDTKGFEKDETRLVLHLDGVHSTGYDAAEVLRENGCEVEYAELNFAILIVTPFNTPEDFEKLYKALMDFAVFNKRGRFWKIKRRESEEEIPEFKKPIIKMKTREAVLSFSEETYVEKAAGRIAAEAICPCPPGIPIIMPGEEINDYIVYMLKNSGYEKIRVVATRKII